jgi:tripartite-type tricarboxylate transporter receptor subunit TctC
MLKIMLAALLCAATSVFAQYPQRPVQLIVPWGAGGGTDATARIIATLLEK